MGTGSHNFVAVYLVSLFIHCQASVRIPVKRDSQIISTRHYFLFQLIHMSGSALVIYINTIRLTVNKVGVHIQPLKQFWSNGRGRPVGAIHKYPDIVVSPFSRHGKVLYVLLHRFCLYTYYAAQFIKRSILWFLI